MSKYYDIEDSQTGKVYTIEGPEDAKPEELTSYMASLHSDAQATTPQAGPAATEETAYVNSMPGEQKRLPVAAEQEISGAFANPKMPFEDVDALVKKHQTANSIPALGLAGANGHSPQDVLAAYRRGLATGKTTPTGVSYHSAVADLPVPAAKTHKADAIDAALGVITDPLHPTQGMDTIAGIRRSAEATGHSPDTFFGFLDRLNSNMTDDGGDMIRKHFPGLTEDQYAEIRHNYTGWKQQQQAQQYEAATQNDGVAPKIAGQFLGSAGPELAVPGFGEEAAVGKTLLGRALTSAGIGGGANAAYQGAAIHDNAQDHFDPMESAEAAAMTGALHVGGEALHAGIKSVTGERQPAPTPSEPATPVTAPTANKRTKAYNTQLESSRAGLEDHVKSITGQWTNAPEVQVHPTFKDLPGVQKGAVAAITDDGVVHINTRTVLDRAARRNTTPEAEATAAIFHESLGHYGLQQVFRDKLDDTMQDIYTNGPESFRRTVDDFMKKNPNYSGNPIEIPEAVEEILAKRSEKGPLPRTFEDKVRDTIKKLGRKTGFDIFNFDYSSREINSILAQAHDRVIKGERVDTTGSTRMSMPGERPPPKPLDSRQQRQDTLLRRKADQEKLRDEYRILKERGIDPESVGLPKEPGFKYMQDYRADNDNEDKLRRPQYPKHGASDREIAQYHLDDAKFHEQKATIAEANGGNRRAAGYRNTAKIATHSAQLRDPTLAGELSIKDRAQYFREQAQYHDQKMQERAAKGDTAGIERHRMFRDDATDKAAKLADLALKNPERTTKYMMDDIDEEVGKLSPDDLFESKNAFDILDRLVENAKPIHLTIDELRDEAERANVPLSKLKGMEAGELSKKLFMQQIVADKMNEKVTNLYSKLNSGNFSVKDRDNYLQTILKFEDLTAKIFESQGEAGRALRSIREMELTLKKIKGIHKVLGQFLAHSPYEALQDPEVFRRFAQDVQDQIENAKSKNQKSKIATSIANGLNLPRALMASFDLSAPLRQGIFLVGRKEFYSSFKSMFDSAFSKDAHEELVHNIVNRPTYGLMRDAKLALTDLTGNKLSKREESFMSTWAEKIPVAGRMVVASERAYSGFLNKLRADVFDDLVTKANKLGHKLETDANGTYDPETLKFVREIGSYVNNATGRGDLGVLNNSAPVLSGLFFSPRLIASRAQLLNPVYYVKLDPFVRKEAVRDLLTFGGVAMTITALAHFGLGAGVGYDPRSTDFGKIKVGNTHFDILGGFGQFITLGARLGTYTARTLPEQAGVNTGIKGDYVDSHGNAQKYGTKYGQKNAFDAVTTFLRNKFSPVASLGADFLAGQDSVGNKFSIPKAVSSRFIPLFLQDYYSLKQSDGFGVGTAKAVPGLFGVGVQTYDADTQTQQRAESVTAPETFHMKDAPDMKTKNIEVKDGDITLSPAAQKEWQKTEDYYLQAMMKNAKSSPQWKSLDAKQRLALTREAKAEAYKATKEYLLPQLAGQGTPDEEE